ncbi:hypothetical protein HS088_TW07G01243 [Tripterygium wilfordii]|uniref:Uncharacterized protein n=1 Tax=Tripterygium wilfordii TaxID=458696 RepID=A0A7J7DH26_TRIWF|nr:hypothetical protein HS088_TW07G01243 [Tripterygium wilfordii]
MSAVVEVWVSELVRLKEKKVKKVRKPLSLSEDKARVVEVVEEDGKSRAREDSKLGHVHGDNTTISETTVLLLMDRFAPL